MEMKKVHTRRPSHRLEDNTEMDLTKNRMGSYEMDSFGSGLVTVTFSYDHDDELVGSVKVRIFLIT